MDSVKGIDSYSLDNGLKVLLFQDKSAQTSTVNVIYRVGFRYEGYGEKGMHMREKLKTLSLSQLHSYYSYT